MKFVPIAYTALNVQAVNEIFGGKTPVTRVLDNRGIDARDPSACGAVLSSVCDWDIYVEGSSGHLIAYVSSDCPVPGIEAVCNLMTRVIEDRRGVWSAILSGSLYDWAMLITTSDPKNTDISGLIALAKDALQGCDYIKRAVSGWKRSN